MWVRKGFPIAVFLVLLSPAFAQKPVQGQKFVEVDIFITSYKGPSVSDVSAYHDSAAGEEFDSELQSDDDERFCLKSPRLKKTTGLWEGNMEPSWWLHSLGRVSDAEAYAVEHAGKHQQDAVLIFLADPKGPDAEYVLTLPSEILISQTLPAIQKAGFKGATVAGRSLILTDEKVANEESAKELAAALGAEFKVVRGRKHLIMNADYTQLLDAYESVPHSCPLH